MHISLNPTPIIDLAVALWGSKTLLSAVELGLFTAIAQGPLDCDTLPRAARDFLDALVALGMLTHTGKSYTNTPETATFLVRGTLEYGRTY
jgi:hypothetical protein